MKAIRLVGMTLAAMLIIPFSSRAEESFKTEYTLLLDATGNQVVAHPWRTVKAKTGFGGNLGFEIRPLKFIAGGIQATYRNFPGTNAWHVTTLDVVGKLFPLGRTRMGEAYLDGGVGIIVPKDNDVDKYRKHVHGTAGAGYRFFCPKHQDGFLDLGLVLDAYSPAKRPLTTLGVKVGLGWRFGGNGAPKEKLSHEQASSSDSGRQSSMDKVKEGSTSGYVVKEGDNLWDISRKEEIYRKGSQWKRIYDANRESIKDPNLIYPKQELTVEKDAQ